MVPGCPGTSKKISTLVLVHIVRSVFLLLGLLAWFPTRPCAAQIYSTVPYKPVKNSLVPFVYTCTAYLFFGLYTSSSTLCEVLCEVPFLSCDLLLCVGDGGGGGGLRCSRIGNHSRTPTGYAPEPGLYCTVPSACTGVFVFVFFLFCFSKAHTQTYTFGCW